MEPFSQENWEVILASAPFEHCCLNSPHLQPFRTAVYYQTYGGGLEGGYVMMPDGDVYKVERKPFEPFGLPIKIDGMTLIFKLERCGRSCHLVPRTGRCCLCQELLDTPYGHNPFPLCDVDDTTSRACSSCNSMYVISARLLTMEEDVETPEEARASVRFYEDGVRRMLALQRNQ